MNAADYFSSDYNSARKRFREMCGRAGASIESLELNARGPAGEELTIDIGWLGAVRPQSVVLHSSGLHGVEGFAGSAIQLQLLDDLPPIAPETSLVLVHILNPYGMAWIRRVNERNVDLNRNFIMNGEFRGAPSTYAKLHSFLNPTSWPAVDLYYTKIAWLILKHGMAALKEAIVGGQYDFPNGLFYGGAELEKGPALYRAFLERRLSGTRRLIAIDVHTGLGPYGKTSLFVEPEDQPRMAQSFGERVITSEADRGAAYQVRGGIQTMIFGLLGRRHADYICQEFGTYPSARVLRVLRDENRAEHFAGGTPHPEAKRLMKETFIPQDDRWKCAVIEQGRAVVLRALEILSG